MKITRGATLEKYARIYGLEIGAVVEWVNDYVNHPEKCVTPPENTEKERFESIKCYIQGRINESSTEKIKQSIERAKNDTANDDPL